MRRKSATRIRSWRPYDIEKDLKPGQLSGIGKVNVAWNDLEGALDVMLCLAMELPPPIWLSVQSRINGIDGKVGIIREAAKSVQRLHKSEYARLDNFLGALLEHKRYRDGVIHARITDPDSPIAETAQRKGKTDEVLVSEEALNALFIRLTTLGLEMESALHIFHFRNVVRVKFHIERKQASDPEILEAAQLLRDASAQLREHQRRRQSWPPLPPFPEEPSIHPMSEAPESPPDEDQ